MVIHVIGMENKSSVCSGDFEYEKVYQVQKSSYLTLILVIAGAIIIFTLFMVFIYRRVLHRQVQNEMNQ